MNLKKSRNRRKKLKITNIKHFACERDSFLDIKKISTTFYVSVFEVQKIVQISKSFFQVGDMLLMDWQVHDHSSGENSGRQSHFYFEANYYWNTTWNESERKYMIPFQKHPKSDAQVSFILLFNIFKTIY